MQIRKATVEDAEMLTEMARKSFYDTFHEHPKNDPVDLQDYMDEAFTVEAFSAEILDPDSFWFIAEIENQPAGYVKIKQNSREKEISGENPLEIVRLYALQNYIGKGVGKSLMVECLNFAAENAHDVIWLGVWEYNYRAQEFYKKFGFAKCGEHIFQLGSDPQIDWLMERKV